METQEAASQLGECLFTESEVCDYLRIRPRQLYTWRMQGLIPYFKIGKAVRFRKSEIDSALEELRFVS